MATAFVKKVQTDGGGRAIAPPRAALRADTEALADDFGSQKRRKRKRGAEDDEEVVEEEDAAAASPGGEEVNVPRRAHKSSALPSSKKKRTGREWRPSGIEMPDGDWLCCTTGNGPMEQCWLCGAHFHKSKVHLRSVACERCLRAPLSLRICALPMRTTLACALRHNAPSQRCGGPRKAPRDVWICNFCVGQARPDRCVGCGLKDTLEMVECGECTKWFHYR